ncbi:MAG: hypothetical protein CMF45_08060 [Legionellales bacterium]|nr:hypothetical protein [Legionellales bacterium]
MLHYNILLNIGFPYMRYVLYLLSPMLLSFYVLASDYKELNWDQLMPEAELEIMKQLSTLLSNPHQPLDPNANIRDDINNAMEQISDPDVQGVMNSINVRPELNNQTVSIPGFVVPIETNDENAITEFFLVPYFGACIHVPPPPPNQIIFVQYNKGLQVNEIWMPFEIKGTLFTEMLRNDVAISAYTFVADDVSEYEE